MATNALGHYQRNAPLWKINQARKNEDFDWNSWERAIDRLKRNGYKRDADRMRDAALVDRGWAIIDSQQDNYIEQKPDPEAAMMNLVRAEWANEKIALTDDDVRAIVAIGRHLRIDTAPGMSMIYVAEIAGQKRILPSYQAMIVIAKRKYSFAEIFRPMTEAECKAKVPFYQPEDVCWACEIYEKEAMEIAQIAGLDPAKFAKVEFGWWKNKQMKRKQGGGYYEAGPDDIPNGWSASDVAKKRALKKALRMLGLDTMFDIPGFGQMLEDETPAPEWDGEIVEPSEPQPEEAKTDTNEPEQVTMFANGRNFPQPSEDSEEVE